MQRAVPDRGAVAARLTDSATDRLADGLVTGIDAGCTVDVVRRPVARGVPTLCSLAASSLLLASCSGSETPADGASGEVASPAPTSVEEAVGSGGEPDASPADTSPTSVADEVTPPLGYRPVGLDDAIGELGDPATRLNGVIGIFDELGIGVYTASGTSILAGSETGPDDLWVAAEFLPGIELALDRPGPLMPDYLAVLGARLGLDLTPAELAATYEVMLQELPDYPMSRVIRALDIEFVPSERLTRFEAWLLYLVWLAPNGPVAGPVGFASVDRRSADADTPCGPTGAGGEPPGYSLADQYGATAADAAGGEIQTAIAEGALGNWAGSSGSAAKVAGALDSIGKWVIKPITMARDGLSAMQAALNIDVAVDTEPISTHEVHDGEGETKQDRRVEVTTTVRFAGASASDESDCAALAALGLPPPGSPIEGAQVEFVLDGDLAEHGTVRRRSDQNSARASTDAAGQVVVWYEPNPERPESAQSLGDAFEHRVQGTFTVSVNATAALGQLFNVFSGWEFALDLLGLNEIDGEITVRWHDPAAELLVVEPLPGWNGESTLRLRTCDGIEWSGSLDAAGSREAGGQPLTIVSFSELQLSMPSGSTQASAPVLFENTVTATVPEGSAVTTTAQTGTATLRISENGEATVELDLEAGTSDVVVTAAGQTVTTSGTVDAFTRSSTAQLVPADCDDG